MHAPDRREFASLIAAALAAAGLTPVQAQKLNLADAKKFRDSLEGIVRVRFGKHLSDAEVGEVMTSLFRGIALSQQLAKHPLANDADPAAAFRADLP